MKELEKKFGNGLVVIGVHSPKYDSEKSDASVTSATHRYGIDHPVVNDPEIKLWREYKVDFWPTFVLIDPGGNVVGGISGDSHMDRLEREVGKLIAQARQNHQLDEQKQVYAPVAADAGAPAATLRYPEKITADKRTDRIYIADSGHNRIVVTGTAGNIVDTIGSGTAGLADGSFTAAQFNYPQGLALSGRTLYICDSQNNCVRVADLDSRTVKTLAGTGKRAMLKDTGGRALATDLDTPVDLVKVGDLLYVSMNGLHQIWCLDLKNQMIKPVAGSGIEDLTDGSATEAKLAQPDGITSDGQNVYFIDSESSSVRKLDPHKGT
ncbi:MAG: thioredoxin-like domain-containing protein, partial [Terriglobales bacterium]